MPARSSVIGGVGSAVRFLAPAWRKAWAALILAGAAIGAFLDAVGWGAAPAGQVAWFVLALLAATVAEGALYRSALARPGVGPGGLQWGGTEARLLAVRLLGAAFLGVLSLLVLVALLACAYAVASAGSSFAAADPATWAPAVDARGRWVLGGAGMLGAVALMWASLRLRLAPVASVARGRVQVLSAWPMTRGMAAAILAATVLLGLAPAALVAAAHVLGSALRGSPATAGGAINFATGVAVAGLWLPMNAGLMTYLCGRSNLAAP